MAHGAPSASVSYNWSNDVLISFRGLDALDFTSHLHDSLCQKELRVFLNDGISSNGEAMRTILFNVINASRVAIIVFSENFPNSRFCLQEVVEILKCLPRRDLLIIPVFYGVGFYDVRYQTQIYAKAVAQLGENFFYRGDQVPKWRGRQWSVPLVESGPALYHVSEWRRALHGATNHRGYVFNPKSTNWDFSRLVEQVTCWLKDEGEEQEGGNKNKQRKEKEEEADDDDRKKKELEERDNEKEAQHHDVREEDEEEGEDDDNEKKKDEHDNEEEVEKEEEEAITDFTLWEKGEEIGVGAYGTVYVARHRETGALCAVKKLHKHYRLKNDQSLRQEKCDALFKDLLRHGYPCLSLHGAKDQTDRESTISDFKNNVCNLLIATSIAARGLDVKELELVINFDVPNHYEDYVHRVGRTGRAGRKGCAITFIPEEEARYAPDLVKALELSEQIVPHDLKALADGFMAKVNQGLERAHGTGYGGSGFKFNEEEDEVRRAAKKAQAKEYGFEEDKSDSEDEDEGIRKAGGDISQHPALAQILVAATKANTPAMPSSSQVISNGGLPASLPAVLGLQTAGVMPGTGLPVVPSDGASRAALAAMNLQNKLAKIAGPMPNHYEAKLEINDFPPNARWTVTQKEPLHAISLWTGAAITTGGKYFRPGRVPGPYEQKLYLFIEGPIEQSVKTAKADLKRLLEDITYQAPSFLTI